MTTYLLPYVLIVWIVGQPPRVSVEQDFWSCTARIAFEVRFDPRVQAMCLPREGGEA